MKYDPRPMYARRVVLWYAISWLITMASFNFVLLIPTLEGYQLHLSTFMMIIAWVILVVITSGFAPVFATTGEDQYRKNEPVGAFYWEETPICESALPTCLKFAVLYIALALACLGQAALYKLFLADEMRTIHSYIDSMSYDAYVLSINIVIGVFANFLILLLLYAACRQAHRAVLNANF